MVQELFQGVVAVLARASASSAQRAVLHTGISAAMQLAICATRVLWRMFGWPERFGVSLRCCARPSPG